MNKSDYTLVCVGVSHWKTPVEIREKFSLNELQQAELLQKIKSCIDSGFIISTCNRTEIYAITNQAEQVYNTFRLFVPVSYREFDAHVYNLKSLEAMQHLYEMSIGIDAQILGDLQIIGQVKDAFQLSQKLGFSDSNLQRLMQNVYNTCKRVRSETDLCQGAASIPHAVVVTIKEKFPDLNQKNILLFGTGKMGSLTVKNLVDNGFKNIVLINRTDEKADKLAQDLKLPKRNFNELNEIIESSDIIIVATGASLPTITIENINALTNKSAEKLFIDVSVPRNVDAQLKNLPNISIADMDDLHAINTEVLGKRQNAIPNAQKMIEESIFEYLDWLHHRSISPFIQSFREKINDIKDKELEQYKNKFTNTEYEKVQKITQSIVNRIINNSIENIKLKYKQNPELLHALSELYDLKTNQYEHS